MRVYKTQYGWSTSAHSKTKEGATKRCYVECNFKQGTEPLIDAVEGKLIFRQDDGSERECFLSSYEKQGVMIPKLVLMDKLGPVLKKVDTPVQKADTPKSVQQTLTGDGRDMLGFQDESYDPNLKINTDDLPFY